MMWIVCPLIIGLVLLQGAAGDISSAFGGGGMLDSTLGVGAHRKMAKFTGILAGVFFIMVLVLAYTGKSSLKDVNVAPLPATQAAGAPTVPPSASSATAGQTRPTATGASVALPAEGMVKQASSTSAVVSPAPVSTPVIVPDAPVATPAVSEAPAPPVIKHVEPATPPPAPETHPETSQQSATAAPIVPPAAPAPK